MEFIIIGLGILFVSIGLGVTKNNAKYLLSGYNLMSDEEQQKFNIESYLLFFRKFHFYFGITFILTGITVNWVFGINAAHIFTPLYPIAAYIFFLFLSNKREKNKYYHKNNSIGIGVLIITFALIVALFIVGSRENRVIFTESTRIISIKGPYGEDILFDDIAYIEFIDKLPEITRKTNAVSFGNTKKGFYKTAQGEIIKLLINTDYKSYLLIIKENGNKVYLTGYPGYKEKLIQYGLY